MTTKFVTTASVPTSITVVPKVVLRRPPTETTEAQREKRLKKQAAANRITCRDNKNGTYTVTSQTRTHDGQRAGSYLVSAHPAGVMLVPLALAHPGRADRNHEVRAGALAVMGSGLRGDSVRAILIVAAGDTIGSGLLLQALLALRLGRLRWGATENNLRDYCDRRWNTGSGYELCRHCWPLFA
jgi:hypothetical protein